MHYMKRRITREVLVGNIGVGSGNPIRIQSMISAPLEDSERAVAQILALYNEGCEIVRFAIINKKEAYFAEKIKNELLKRGCPVPLVADIHFYPEAALIVTDFVEKVRINPGNYVKIGKECSETESVQKITEKLLPLIEKCKKLKRALRLGVNQGSLSERITMLYGGKEQGMIASLIEYAEICERHDLYDLIFSMKSSSPSLLISAYRKLAETMDRLGWNYPLHLGVTEAGRGVEGRVKSAIGTGVLLSEGIGDTIRVSLTEDSLQEVRFCKKLVSIASVQQSYSGKNIARERSTSQVAIGMPCQNDDECKNVNVKYWLNQTEGYVIADGKKLTLVNLDKILTQKGPFAAFVSEEDEKLWQNLLKNSNLELIVASKECNLQRFNSYLQLHKINTPLSMYFNYPYSGDDLICAAGIEIGGYLCDGVGSGIILNGQDKNEFLYELAKNLIQGCNRGSFQTEFISCPTCGRTLYDVEKICMRLSQSVGHLPHIKIAIMGCIVNGIGEVGDSDFGYVGAANGKIDLYAGKQCIKKGVDSANAEEELIALIKAHGKWRDV